MSDYQTMRNRILDESRRNGELTAQCNTAIQSAIKYYENRRFWFNEARASANTVDSQEYYGLPSDFVDIDSIVITVNTWTYPLMRQQYQTIEDWFVKSDTYTSYPTDYAIYHENLRLYPVPNGAYEMKISYQKSLSTLSAEADTNAWMAEAEELIRGRAGWDFNWLITRNDDTASKYKQMEIDTLSALEEQTVKYILSGKTKSRNW